MAGSVPSIHSGAITLGFNFMAAIACIFVNRRLLKPPVSFNLPISLTLVGYAASVVGLSVCRRMGYISQRNTSKDHSPTKTPPNLWSLIITTAIAPVLANYSLLLNSVGIYQLSKVLVTPAIVTLERMRGGPALSMERGFALIVVSLGVTIVTVSDMSLDVIGLIVALANISVAGYYKVDWGHTCRTFNLKSLELMSMVMPKATALLAMLAVIIEGTQLIKFQFTLTTFVLLLLCGVSAFLTSWSGYVVISELSALTHQLLGQAKTLVILIIGHFFFHSSLTIIQVYGALLAMAAMVAYTALTINSRPILPTTRQSLQRMESTGSAFAV